MATKRMVSKKISLSTKVNSMCLKSKFIYTWCIPHLDDYGLITNEPDKIKAMVFPRAKEISTKDITSFMVDAQETESGPLIKEYDDCIEYLEFTKHNIITEEKRAKSDFQRIPKNPQESPEKPKKVHNKLVKVSLREVNISKDLLFKKFWESYPRKENKKNALKSFLKINPDEKLLEQLLFSLEKFKESKQWQDKQYIPLPTSWLNGRRWEDEIVSEIPEWIKTGKLIKCRRCKKIKMEVFNFGDSDRFKGICKCGFEIALFRHQKKERG